MVFAIGAELISGIVGFADASLFEEFAAFVRTLPPKG